MTAANFPECLSITLASEGGLSTERTDPGNWTGGKIGKGTLKGTKYGISAAAFPDIDIRNLTLDDVKPIYKTKYWDQIGGDTLPSGFDLATFDYAVNSGPARALRDAQAVIGAPADGKFGPVTRAKAATAGTREIKALCARRLSFMQSLAIWKTYGKGWSARVAKIEAKAVAMFLRGQPGVDAKAALADEAEKAEKTAGTLRRAGAAIAVSASGSAGTGAALPAEPNLLALGALMLAGLVVACVLVMRAAREKERAEAYRAAGR
ncbi:glycoside hydrolase family 108 protein [Rhizobium sp. WYJ-E13]|uniref:glycoside hydrolase family 108 protein n=1 Tax=Rhizobium sp. WYJ-E13 TaxID=2849093 RepID=UPI001C1EC6E3|nr:glycosyl hydrolase 108 family protein [Rhizobium sp. WYJ-E13]QWW66192.1 secretion activator protein [Rhizobium sp. WYJ-E13]